MAGAEVLGITMQPIDLQHLESVRGGFLGALLGAAGPILNGVAGIIGAAKSGKGGGGGGGGAPAPQAPPPAAAATAAAAAPMPIPVPVGSSDPSVSITNSVSINGVQVR